MPMRPKAVQTQTVSVTVKAELTAMGESKQTGVAIEMVGRTPTVQMKPKEKQTRKVASTEKVCWTPKAGRK